MIQIRIVRAAGLEIGKIVSEMEVEVLKVIHGAENIVKVAEVDIENPFETGKEEFEAMIRKYGNHAVSASGIKPTRAGRPKKTAE